MGAAEDLGEAGRPVDDAEVEIVAAGADDLRAGARPGEVIAEVVVDDVDAPRIEGIDRQVLVAGGSWGRAGGSQR